MSKQMILAMEAIEQRAFKARTRMSVVCAEANMRHQVWTNAKRAKRVSPETLTRLELALDAIEARAMAANEQ